MLFNPEVIAAKSAHLDEIMQHPELLESVIGRWAGKSNFGYTPCPRPWEPGGGSTLFRVYTERESGFLKVKHLSVTVESRLEGEAAFSSIPSLRNEYHYLATLSASSANVPSPLGYYEEQGFGFLFLETLKPYSQVEPRLAAVDLVEAYQEIESTVRQLFAQGIAHTDIHELNVMFRGNTPVVADFEEARELQQEVPFAGSLDAVGCNYLGDVGDMPEFPGCLGGHTCLTRLKEVFKQATLKKLPALLRQCNFDSSCPFLNALDHGKDERIYQSINLPGLQIQGQRQLDDERIPQILEVIRSRFDHPIVHLDIGSNLGRFNLELTRSELVGESLGVEAYDKYVELAKVLAFLSDNGKARFFCAECGKDSLFSLVGGRKVDCITIYSVYHHIKNKDAFLEDLRRLSPELILLEMPVQPECYQGRSWQQEMEIICEKLEGGTWELIGETSDYGRPLLLISEIGSRSAQGKRAVCEETVPAWQRPKRSADPKVSVILPTYNHLHYLPGAVQSILQQSHSDFELIIVNDGSTDGTRGYLDSLQESRIRVLHQENARLPRALNAGFGMARGRYLTWTSADNICAPRFLEALVQALDTHPEAGFARGDFVNIDAQDKIRDLHHAPDFSLPRLLRCNPGVAAFMYRKECQEAVGLYDPELEGAEDWDMWLRIMERYRSCHVPEVIYCYRVHDQSMTGQIPEKIRNSVQKTFAKTVRRHGGALDLRLCYPGLAREADRALWACGWIDLAWQLAQTPFYSEIYFEQIRHALSQALALGAEQSQVSLLLALVQARCAQWQAAIPLAVSAQESRQEAVRATAQALHRACLHQDLPLLYAISIPPLDEGIRRLLQQGASSFWKGQ